MRLKRNVALSMSISMEPWNVRVEVGFIKVGKRGYDASVML